MDMSSKISLKKLVLTSLLIVSLAGGGAVVNFGFVFASELSVNELVRKHDEHWESINSIQMFYTKHWKSSVVSRSLPNCYWESDGKRSRAIVMSLDSFSANKNGNPIVTEMCEDVFCDNGVLYRLTVPRDKYPLKEIQLCDYVSLKEEGYHASFVPEGGTKGTDVRMYSPLPTYFLVHTEEAVKTLLELVNKYPSRIVSTQKNDLGDDIVEIAIECNVDGHEHFVPWKMNVFINASKGYNIDSIREWTKTKGVFAIELIAERDVKKYVEIDGNWIPYHWESVLHNGDPSVGIHSSFVVEHCRINDTFESYLESFRFPTNFVVYELIPRNRSRIIHIWGPNNQPAHSFDETLKFMEFFSNECIMRERPQEHKHLAFRITLVIFGLIMIAIALYRLYAKDK